MASKDEQAGQEKSPANMKKLIIVIGAVVLVLGIGLTFFLRSGGSSGKGKEEAAAEKKAPAEGGEKGKEGKGEKGAANTYPLEPFIVNIYDGQEMRYLRVKVEFDTSKPEAKTELDARQAAVRDAILILLTTKTMQDIQDLQGKNQLRDEIFTAVNKIIPPGIVNRVYFTDFVVQ